MAKRKRLGPVDAFASTPTPPTNPVTSPAPDPKPGARPPIASVASEAAATQALAEVSGVLETARSEGRLIQTLPLDSIEADHLIRDRLIADPEDMTALRESLKARGQQTPIEVTDLGAGRYGLISGWRRLHALRALAEEAGTPGTVLARLVAPASQAEAYLAMVEENEIRVGLTYYERARIVSRAVKAGIYPNRKQALQGLFANVSRAKRSKIGSFVDVVEALDRYLTFPTTIGERLGLQLSKAVADQATQNALIRALRPAAPSAEAEQAALQAVLSPPAPAKASKDVVELNGMSVTNSGPKSKGPMVIDGEALTPTLRHALLCWLKAETERTPGS